MCLCQLTRCGGFFQKYFIKIDLIKIVPKPSSKVINSPFLKIQTYLFFAKFPLMFGLVYRELMYRRNQSRFQFPGTQPFNGLQQVFHFLLAHWFFCHCILAFLCILLIEYFHNCSELTQKNSETDGSEIEKVILPVKWNPVRLKYI